MSPSAHGNLLKSRQKKRLLKAVLQQSPPVWRWDGQVYFIIVILRVWAKSPARKVYRYVPLPTGRPWSS